MTTKKDYRHGEAGWNGLKKSKGEKLSAHMSKIAKRRHKLARESQIRYEEI